MAADAARRREASGTIRLGAQAQSRLSAPLRLSLRSFQPRPGSRPPRRFPAMALLDVPCRGQAFGSRGNLFRERPEPAGEQRCGGRAGSGQRSPGANPPGSAAARPAAPTLPFPAPFPAPFPESPGAPAGTRLTSPLGRCRGATSLCECPRPGLILRLRARLAAVRRVAVLPAWANAAQPVCPSLCARTRRYFCLLFFLFLYPLGKGKDGSRARACAAAFRWGRWRMRFPGGGEGSDARLVCSVLVSPSPGTGLSVAFSCTAVPYISLFCSLSGRVGCS